MNQYLVNEIKTFNNSMIPLADYSFLVKELRQRTDNYINLKLLQLHKMLYDEEISKEEFRQLAVITEYERQKYNNLINRKKF